MTILVFGKTGQVATELRAQGTVLALGRDMADLSDPEACVAAIKIHKPRAVINAAAYTAVDRAEDEEPQATVINGAASGAMARVCAARDIPFVHISTDYVFDGTGARPWQPSDSVAPENAYGRSKLAGETAVQAAGGRFAILRTSWVFSAHGANFLKTILRLSESRDALNVVDDQIGGPTPADAIAAACLTIAGQLQDAPDKAGIYHFSGTPETSWKTFACEIFARAGRQVAVTGIPTTEFPTPARRPLNSRMDCTSTLATFDVPQPDWRAGIDRALATLEQTV